MDRPKVSDARTLCLWGLAWASGTHAPGHDAILPSDLRKLRVLKQF